ncbi:hypothetical protein ACVIGA_000001, partial [Bradyrhizobium sp. USDA 3240]
GSNPAGIAKENGRKFLLNQKHLPPLSPRAAFTFCVEQMRINAAV